MPFKIFKFLFPRSTIEALCATKDHTVVLKTYSDSNIEQLGVSLVKARHKDKVTRCRFFIVPGDGPALLGMPDVKLVGILEIMCEVVEDQWVDREFNLQTIESASTLS